MPKANVEKVNAANPAQSDGEARIGGVFVITLEQGGRINSQAKSIGGPYNLFQFAGLHITFHQNEFGFDLTEGWGLSFLFQFSGRLYRGYERLRLAVHSGLRGARFVDHLHLNSTLDHVAGKPRVIKEDWGGLRVLHVMQSRSECFLERSNKGVRKWY